MHETCTLRRQSSKHDRQLVWVERSGKKDHLRVTVKGPVSQLCFGPERTKIPLILKGPVLSINGALGTVPTIKQSFLCE